MKIIIGADIVATKENKSIFNTGNITELIGEKLSNIILNADYRIFNLETAVCKSDKKINKAGPHIKMDPSSFNGISSLKPTILSLANNHVFDYGFEGLEETLDIIKQNNIMSLGAGIDLIEARRPVFLNKDNITIGVYACTEHEFSINGAEKPGCNPFDEDYTYNDVHMYKSQCDLLIVLYHGGKEQYRFPTPQLQKRCRRMAECGADIIICQHSHCIGSLEEYKNATIIYGQGNFIFNDKSIPEFDDGMLIKINVEKYNNLIKKKLEFIPVISTDRTIRLAEKREKENIMSLFYSRSEQLLENGFVETNFDNYIDTVKDQYFKNISGKLGNLFLVRLLNKVLLNKFYTYLYHDSALLLNMFECETHREILIAILKKELSKK